MSTAVVREDLNQIEQELKDAAERAMQLAKAAGASASEVDLSFGLGINVTARLSEVETIEYERDRGLTITTYFGQKKGHASTTDLSAEGLAFAVKKAASIASFTAEDDCAGLAAAERMATEFPDLDLYHPWDITPDEAVALAVETERAATAYDSRIENSEGASVSKRDGVSVYANSHGFMGSRRGSTCSLVCSVIASDDAGMERDYYYTSARKAEDLESAQVVGEAAARQTVERLGAQPISTRQAPVLIKADLASSLIGHLLSAISGGAIYRDASFLRDKVGERIFPEFINIEEQPLLLGGPGSASFDSEGVATYQKDLIRDGVLQTYLLGSYSARKLNLESTANAGGTHNVIVQPGELDQQGMLREMGSGLLVTELIGHGVNGVNGDYSRGAAGFWVENGEIAYPVNEITLAGNLLDMFANVALVGADVDRRGGVQTGSILLNEMTIAGS